MTCDTTRHPKSEEGQEIWSDFTTSVRAVRSISRVSRYSFKSFIFHVPCRYTVWHSLAFTPRIDRRCLSYTLPLNRFATISRAVIRTVLKNDRKSRVEKIVSANPKGSIGGIHPVKTEPQRNSRRQDESVYSPTAYSRAQPSFAKRYCLTFPLSR